MGVKKTTALVVGAAGVPIAEMRSALERAGAAVVTADLARLRKGLERVLNFDICVLPAGLEFSNASASTQLVAQELKPFLGDIKSFIRLRRPLLAVGGGFQALVKAGILPASPNRDPIAGFAPNDSGRFESRWTFLRINAQSACLFFRGLPEMIELPVAHKDGKLVLKSPRHLEEIKRNHSIVLQYVGEDGRLLGYPYNPDGSIFNIAGLANPEGNCLGLMPRPERFMTLHHHPNWTRQTFFKQPAGLEMIRNAVRYCR